MTFKKRNFSRQSGTDRSNTLEISVNTFSLLLASTARHFLMVFKRSKLCNTYRLSLVGSNRHFDYTCYNHSVVLLYPCETKTLSQIITSYNVQLNAILTHPVLTHIILPKVVSKIVR